MTVAKGNHKHSKRPPSKPDVKTIMRTESRKPETCTKKTYRTKKKAIRALDRIIAFNDRHADAPRSAYQCQRCGFWHLTSYEKTRHAA